MARFAIFLNICAILFLTACGFTPVYSTNGSGVGRLNIKQIDGRVGYFLQQDLTRKSSLERSDEVRNLEVSLSSGFTDLALNTTGFNSRTRMNITANYTLSNGDNAPIIGTVTVSLGYDTSSSAPSEIAAMSDIEERAANLLAERIWLDMLSKIRNQSR